MKSYTFALILATCENNVLANMINGEMYELLQYIKINCTKKHNSLTHCRLVATS